MALRGKLGWVLAANVFGVALSGCQTTIALQPPRGYLDFGYRGGEGREVRVVSPFEDARTRGECPGDVEPSGHVVKSEAMIPGAEEQLRCSQEPPVWFAERLTTALRGAGYTVLGANEPGKGDVLELHGHAAKPHRRGDPSDDRDGHVRSRHLDRTRRFFEFRTGRETRLLRDVVLVDAIEDQSLEGDAPGEARRIVHTGSARHDRSSLVADQPLPGVAHRAGGLWPHGCGLRIPVTAV